MIGKAIFNRAPLTKNRLAPLPLGAIKPEGWLKEQLKTQAAGLTDKLYDSWPTVGENSTWLGGDGQSDGPELAPYYLDGLLPTAYLLDDEALKARSQKYVEWMLNSQRENGWFGPEDNDEWWPRMVALKGLQQYFLATGDRRVLLFMDKYFRYQVNRLDEQPLQEWAVARAGDNMLIALWLYNLTGMNYLLTLCKKLKEQSLDWTNHFQIFPHVRPMSRQRPWKELKKGREEEGRFTGTDQKYYGKEYHLSHVVNVAMGLKTPGVINLFKSGFKEVTAFKVGWQKLMKHHGVAYGMFTGDEHLSGANPSQGTETCAVAEMMYTLETLIGLGDEFAPELSDILEKLAFNALPAALTGDMMGHQYDQQANQVRSSDEPRGWYNNDSKANVFGLNAHRGCCTANFHQAWPKFISSLWYATADDGLAAISYAPCTVNFVAGKTRVRLKVDTLYPFDGAVKIEVSVKQPAEFPIYLRIPGWAKQAMIRLPEGEIMQVRAGETTCLRKLWRTGDVIQMDLPMEPRMTQWYLQSSAVELGPLLMCFRPEEKWTMTSNEGIAPDYRVDTEEAWNWALIEGELMKVVKDPGAVHAFKRGGDVVKVLIKVAKAEDWGMDAGSAAPPPVNPKVDMANEQIITLTPYGNSSLRIAQFPTVKALRAES